MMNKKYVVEFQRYSLYFSPVSIKFVWYENYQIVCQMMTVSLYSLSFLEI